MANEKKGEGSIKIYDDCKTHGSFAIVITLPAIMWHRRKKIEDAIAKILEVGNV